MNWHHRWAGQQYLCTAAELGAEDNFMLADASQFHQSLLADDALSLKDFRAESEAGQRLSDEKHIAHQASPAGQVA